MADSGGSGRDRCRGGWHSGASGEQRLARGANAEANSRCWWHSASGTCRPAWADPRNLRACRTAALMAAAIRARRARPLPGPPEPSRVNTSNPDLPFGGILHTPRRWESSPTPGCRYRSEVWLSCRSKWAEPGERLEPRCPRVQVLWGSSQTRAFRMNGCRGWRVQPPYRGSCSPEQEIESAEETGRR